MSLSTLFNLLDQDLSVVLSIKTASNDYKKSESFTVCDFDFLKSVLFRSLIDPNDYEFFGHYVLSNFIVNHIDLISGVFTIFCSEEV